MHGEGVVSVSVNTGFMGSCEACQVLSISTEGTYMKSAKQFDLLVKYYSISASLIV